MIKKLEWQEKIEHMKKNGWKMALIVITQAEISQ